MPTKRRETGNTAGRGPAGPRGRRGPAGPQMARADILAVVEDQFYELRKRLDVQLTRTGEFQQQLDAQRQEIAELRRAVETTHQLLKQIVSKAS